MSNPPSWRTKRRLAIVAAAGRLFARESFERVQMDEIAREAGLGKPTLYRYFPSKQDLYLAVCDAAFSDLERRMAAAGTGCPPPEGIRRMVDALVTVLDQQMTTVSLLDKEAGPLSSRWRAVYRRHRRAIAGHLAGVIAAGTSRSEFHNCDLEIVPSLIIGAIRGALSHSDGMSRARLIEQTTAFILDGLGAGAIGRTQAPKPSMRAGGLGVS